MSADVPPLLRGVVGGFAIGLMLLFLAIAVVLLLRSNARRYPLAEPARSDIEEGLDSDDEADQARALLLVHYLAMRDELDELSNDHDLPERTRNRCRHLAARADGLLS